jgi:hypothetical protein
MRAASGESTREVEAEIIGLSSATVEGQGRSLAPGGVQHRLRSLSFLMDSGHPAARRWCLHAATQQSFVRAPQRCSGLYRPLLLTTTALAVRHDHCPSDSQFLSTATPCRGSANFPVLARNNIPSQVTFLRVSRVLDPKLFNSAFRRRVAELLGIDEMIVIAQANAEREKDERKRAFWMQKAADFTEKSTASIWRARRDSNARPFGV